MGKHSPGTLGSRYGAYPNSSDQVRPSATEALQVWPFACSGRATVEGNRAGRRFRGFGAGWQQGRYGSIIDGVIDFATGREAPACLMGFYVHTSGSVFMSSAAYDTNWHLYRYSLNSLTRNCLLHTFVFV